MGKTLKYGSHDFPADRGFTGSTGKMTPVRGHMRKLGFNSQPPAPGAPMPKPKLTAPPVSLGHARQHREKPVSQMDAVMGPRSPLLPGYKRGGKVDKC